HIGLQRVFFLGQEWIGGPSDNDFGGIVGHRARREQIDRRSREVVPLQCRLDGAVVGRTEAVERALAVAGREVRLLLWAFELDQAVTLTGSGTAWATLML